MTVCLNYELEMLRNVEALYKQTDRQTERGGGGGEWEQNEIKTLLMIDA